MTVDDRRPGFGQPSLGAQTYVVAENGRWAVYLDVAMVEDGSKDGDFQVVRRRIRDYASEAEAEIAARFIGRGASRDLKRPPGGW